MFRNSLKPLLFVSVVLSLGLTTRRAFADIITDIDLLEPEKKPEEKKKKEVPATPSASKKPTKAKAKDTVKAPEAEPDTIIDLDSKAPQTPPAKAELIPEPIDEVVGSPRPVDPLAATNKGKGKSKEERSKAPVNFKAEGTTTYSRDLSTVTLKRNVTITQDDMRLRSDDAKVTLMPKSKTPTSEAGGVKSAVLDGKVSIVRFSSDPAEKMNSKSDKAVFDNLAQVVTLEGNALLQRGGNTVTGERILYNMTTGEIKVDKARGVVQPERMKK